jgi:hypothetical protein
VTDAEVSAGCLIGCVEVIGTLPCVRADYPIGNLRLNTDAMVIQTDYRQVPALLETRVDDFYILAKYLGYWK